MPMVARIWPEERILAVPRMGTSCASVMRPGGAFDAVAGTGIAATIWPS